MGSSILEPKVTDNTFSSDAEQMKWMEKKCVMDDPEHPPLVDDDNWRLSEFWYVKDLGKKTKTTFTMNEKLQRTGNDQTAGAQMVAVEEVKKNLKGKDPAEKHKQYINKIVIISGRLAKLVGSAENALPGLKRKMPAEKFSSFKKGLGACREVRCSSMEDLEDLKAFPATESDQEIVTAKVEKMHTELSEHFSALKDALSQADASAGAEIKAQVPATPAEDADRVPQQMTQHLGKNETPMFSR